MVTLPTIDESFLPRNQLGRELWALCASSPGCVRNWRSCQAPSLAPGRRVARSVLERTRGEVNMYQIKRRGLLSTVLGVDSFSILFNHRSFQKPVVSPGVLTVCWEEGSLERMRKCPLEQSTLLKCPFRHFIWPSCGWPCCGCHEAPASVEPRLFFGHPSGRPFAFAAT